ncbi:MAG: sodium:solute symporter [Pirellulaceae bacterium]
MLATVLFNGLDWLVVAAYFVGILGLGLYFWRRNNSAEQFTAGGRALSGWLCGLSIFATYLSSISYLALPGKAFVENWNAFVSSLALPFAALIAVRFFVPLYRRSGEVSAYSWLESRFGLWARLFASCFYLLFQIARSGVVMYLMALPMAVLFGWDIRLLIVVTGVVVTAYAFVGGIVAVIWADAIQAIVLLVGALVALCILLWGLPGGPSEVGEVALANDKFSLGDSSLRIVSQPTIWVVLAFGLFDNLRNFGIDQSYIQRYIAARSDAEAAKSVWLGALMYVPVSALFFFIGTSLYVYYDSRPADILEVRQIVAKQKLMQAGVAVTATDYQQQLDAQVAALETKNLGDRVFPHFIASHLPQGVRGLLIAAIFAAAMSTVSTSLNSSATLVMSDFYRRLLAPQATDIQQVGVLRAATIAWGVMGTLMALALVQLTENVLDIWWKLSSILGAGIVGLFLLGIMIKPIRGGAAVAVLLAGMLLIGWMTISQTSLWPAAWENYASLMHPFLVIVVGPVFMILCGWLLSLSAPRK